MWKYVVFVCLPISWATAQNSRTSAHQEHGHGWDIRLAVPGEPGSDYPTLGAIPRTSFSCAGKAPGYYADLETNCQVFRVCTLGSTYGFQSFLCPNGTLFNQAVFVCDWWMNVKCQESAQLFNNNNEKFGNLRLGPQLMKDIKKMLTHPMRNPYDKTAMKSNLVVMQDYKPPFGQLFPNGALIAGPERPPNNIYVPAKQVQFSQNNFGGNDIAFAASTPDPRYLPAAFNNGQRDAEVFQRQRQYGQYAQNQRLQNAPGTVISNGHAGQFTQMISNANLLSTRPTQSYNNGIVQYGQRQLSNTRPTPSISTQNAINIQRGQLNQLNSQYTNYQNPARLNSGKQLSFGEPLTNQQYNSNQVRQPYTYQQPPLQFSNEINGKVGNEAKQNLVSADNEIPSTVITKTLTLKRVIQEPKRGGPKSRITVKTWIVKPSKSAKLINSTPYTYEKPTQPPAEKLIDTTPYVYNRPTSQSAKLTKEAEQPYVYNKPTTQTAKLRSESEQPYVYNKPTARLVAEKEQAYVYNKPTARLVTESEQPYVYNKPTTAAAKQIVSPSKEPSRAYLTPTTPRQTLSRLYLTPTSLPPTQASRLYLAPTTYNPSSRLYLPPLQSSPVLSRQYLAPPTLQQPESYQSEQLRAAPTTPSPTYAVPITEVLSSSDFPQSKQSQTVTNDKNLTFTDILTKEKLDLTVNDIVKDTRTFLKTASPPQFGEYRSDINVVDYVDENYLPPEPISTDSGEKLTSQLPTTELKSARLVATPSTDLVPPVETFTNDNQNSNQLSNLPFYKESLVPTNTIERTVSLKISIPETIATYLFKNQSENNFDHLEILNTGSSNYLVLTNNAESKKNGASFIPIGKIVVDKPTNISNSQALVFSLLADSINVAKEYSNTAHQEQSAQLRAPIQNINNDDLAHITNKISQLTSSQYSGNNQAYKSANIVSTVQTTTKDQGYQYRDSGTNNLSQNQIQSSQRVQNNYGSTQTTNQPQSARLQSGTGVQYNTVQSNSKQVYSGQLYQLPVPEVTNQYYNGQNNGNVQSSKIQQQENFSSQNNNVVSSNNNNRAPDGDVEIIKSQSIPITSGKLQASPTTELDEFNSQENFSKFISTNNGISAQLQDKIVGTINHPLSDNKLVTYKKDESYYVYTKLDNSFPQNIQTNGNLVQLNIDGSQKSAKLTQGNDFPNVVAFQFIPSVSYQLEDEKEQQKILNAFQIDEFGSPKQKLVQTSSVDYSVDHTPSAKQFDRQFNEVNNLYAGPSSYSAPQSSVGKLQSRQDNVNARLELEENNNGYSKVVPSRQFTF
ncbi:probable serine/threonine-protein kinase nek3 [Ostrinia nubilalis]|uniref:probable serine/threonine-protein kinase nek3 n=1 Tax=Ostrinia nubilalis TaxID=29057 RepID=UPI0030822FA6